MEAVKAEVRQAAAQRMPEPANYAEALKQLVHKAHLASEKHRDQQARPQRLGADPDLLRFERAFCRRFEKLGVPMFPHCIVRGRHEQNRLFVTGKSLARFPKSPHNFGMAVDLVHGVHAWNLSKGSWEIVGHVGKEVAAQLGVKVSWGGDWRFYDPAHWELSDWRSRSVGLGPLQP